MERFSFVVGVIGIGAFLLAIPMAVVANILTPKIAAWWATTSHIRRQKRIAYLELQLRQLDCRMLLSVRHERMLRGFRYIAIAGALMIYFLLIPITQLIIIHDHLHSLSQGITIPRPPLSPRSSRVYALEFICLTLGVVIQFLCSRAFKEFHYASKVYLANLYVRRKAELAELTGDWT